MKASRARFLSSAFPPRMMDSSCAVRSLADPAFPAGSVVRWRGDFRLSDDSASAAVPREARVSARSFCGLAGDDEPGDETRPAMKPPAAIKTRAARVVGVLSFMTGAVAPVQRFRYPNLLNYSECEGEFPFPLTLRTHVPPRLSLPARG